MIFDLGGVVVPSPFDAFAAYERDHDLPDRFIRDVVAASADHGAWARLERGELTMPQFHDAFAAECAAAGGIVDAAELMGAIGAGLAPAGDRDDARSTSATGGLDGLFDVVVESSVEGLRKPDPRIYRLTCDRLGVTPPEVVFLDDLGVNLKPARELGMTTIKVVEPADALRELAGHLGFAV